jgi:hypothetical protein
VVDASIRAHPVQAGWRIAHNTSCLRLVRPEWLLDSCRALLVYYDHTILACSIGSVIFINGNFFFYRPVLYTG